ncbi:MAG: nucleoside kinase [Candidatus Cloacimonetes bacterium]|nr:nucleoside kinase [Candidatus Cloacimonadota bacterium]
MSENKNIKILDLIIQDKKDNNHVITYKINNNFMHGNTPMEGEYIIEPIYLNSREGTRIYQDFVIFLLAMSIHELYGTKEELSVEHSIGDGIYCQLAHSEATAEILETIKSKIQELIDSRIPINKVTLSIEKACEIFEALNRPDVLQNLHLNQSRYIDIYQANDFYDYYPRPLPPNTYSADTFKIELLEGGFVVRFPKGKDYDMVAPFNLPKLLFKQNQEHDKWLKILKVNTVGDMNELIIQRQIQEFILTEESLHEKKIATIADSIKERKTVKIILIAGPSSSGKTTFAKRISIQMRIHGYVPYVMGLDDYFLSRTKTPRLENGDYDFESIHALDLELLNKDLTALLDGKEVRLPQYNFITGESEISKHKLQMGEDNILIIEGIHALNEMLTQSIPAKYKVKIYISALNQLNIDSHNRIPTTDFRKIRRLVRDFQFRGYSAEETIKRWPAVRAGEDTNIFPFQENADYMFNSSLTYELGVLRKYAMPLLRAISYTSPVYYEAQDLIELIQHFFDINDDKVPNNSLLREFMSNSIFEY